MKKFIASLIFVVLTITGFSQGLFSHVTSFPVNERKDIYGNVTRAVIATYKWEWRLDGTIELFKQVYHKDTKQWIPEYFTGIGPAIGIQRFVPKSPTDPTPINTYGASLGVAGGKTFDVVLQINVWEVLKGGITYTTNVPSNISPWGYFIGTGITFGVH